MHTIIPDPLTNPMENHLYLKSFSIIHRYSIHFHISCLKKYNISGHQIGYIAFVSQQPGISQETLAGLLRLNKASVAKGVRQLVENGYIERRPSQKDKRAYELYPTEKVQGLLEDANKVAQELETILVKGMSPDEQKLFKQLLEKASTNVAEAVPSALCK